MVTSRGLTAAPTDAASALAALIRQLHRSQWAAPADIRQSQLRHVTRLAEHCATESPAFAGRLIRAGLSPDDLSKPDGYAKLPVLTRRSVQEAGPELFCREVPAGHGDIAESRTSGSTGEPVVVKRTGITTLFWNAIAMRELQWHGRNLTGRICSIRADISTPTPSTDWGPPASLLTFTGPGLALPIAADVGTLVEWVRDFHPTTLVIYPTTLDAFTTHCERRHVSLPGLQHVLTIGETLSPRVRARASAWFEASVADCYSSQEFGYIAAECPVSGLYHVMAESVLAEVLTDEGTPCAPGEVGRVTLTDLHNYATPLVRYDIGDFAEVAPQCPCGRGLPTWSRILGRERNLILMPDGTRRWPVTGFRSCREIAPIVQFQLVQEDRETVEARLVVERTLSRGEEDRLRLLFETWVGHPFTMRFRYFADRVPPATSGKYEEFVCKVSDPTS